VLLQVLDCQQPYEVGGRTFNNNDPKVRKVSTTEAIVQSVNVCTLKMAQAAGKEFGGATCGACHKLYREGDAQSGFKFKAGAI